MCMQVTYVKQMLKREPLIYINAFMISFVWKSPATVLKKLELKAEIGPHVPFYIRKDREINSPHSIKLNR